MSTSHSWAQRCELCAKIPTRAKDKFMNKRPLSITILSFVFIAAGVTGLAYHFRELNPQQPFQSEAIRGVLVRLIAILCGTFMLGGSNWARWLTLGWVIYHVILSMFHSLPQLAIHALLLGVVGYFLFTPQAARYFRDKRKREEAT
jgi:hypothetical protein